MVSIRLTDDLGANAYRRAMDTTANAAHIAGEPSGHAARQTNVNVQVEPQLIGRHRLSCALRPILALPHILLIGGPISYAVSFGWRSEGQPRLDWGAGSGVLGAVAAVCAIIGWFAIVFGGRYPEGLSSLAAFYLRWRVRGVAYLALLRDEYPPFGDGPYAATVTLPTLGGARNRVSVAFRIFLALPHLIVLSLLGIAWAVTTIVAWVSIIFTGAYPAPLYDFGVGMLRWSTRVEAYLLLLDDAYPPFSLD
jgi:uncharacterized protein DUF4389